jgi:hypothetical protein
VKAETEFDRKEMKADREATEVCQEKMEAAVHSIRAWLKETMACQETTEACLESKELTSVQMESWSEHQEARKEEATVKSFGPLKKRHGDLHLAIGRREKPPKVRTQSYGGSRKKLAAAGRRMTRRAGVARRKGQGCAKNPEMTDVRDETSDESGRHHWNKEARLKEATTSEEREDIRQDPRENHWAGDREANSRIFRQDRKMRDWTLWRVGRLRKTARSVGAPSLWVVYLTGRKNRIIVINLDGLAPCEGTARDERP